MKSLTLLLAATALAILATSAHAASQVSTSLISTTGVIVSGVASTTGSSIDFSQANIVYTSAACGAFTLTNMADGGTYTLVAKGSGTGPATFAQTGLTVHTTGTLTCGSGKHTIFSIMRAGTDAYVNMVTGF